MKKTVLLFALLWAMPVSGQWIEKTEAIEQDSTALPLFKSEKYATLKDFVDAEIVIPAGVTEPGRAIVSFVVDEKSKAKSIKLVYADNPAFIREALRLVNMTEWQPTDTYGDYIESPVQLVVPFCKDTAKVILPIFPYEESFQGYFAAKIAIPYELIEKYNGTKISVEYVVEKDGSMDNEVIKNSPDTLITQEISKFLKESPKWLPGIENGKPVRVKYLIPLTLRWKEEADNE